MSGGSRKPLSADMIRKAGKPPVAGRSELPALLAAASEALAEVAKRFTSAPVRVEPDGFAVVEREVPLAGAVTAKFSSAQSTLSPVLTADPMLVMALTEAAFGGSGTEPAHDGADRPLSKTEARLRQALLEGLSERLPEALQQCFDTAFSKAEEEKKKPVARETKAVQFIGGRLLIYVFGYSGEVLLLFPEDEMTELLGSGAGTGTEPRHSEGRETFINALAASELTITAMLPVETMPVGAIAGLRTGQTLKLKADARSTVLLQVEGKSLHHAHFVNGSEAISLEISEG